MQDVRADREGEIASVATVLGAHPTVSASTGAYLVAASALLLAPWPGWLAAALPLPYAVNAASFWSVRDADCERANRGWRPNARRPRRLAAHSGGTALSGRVCRSCAQLWSRR